MPCLDQAVLAQGGALPITPFSALREPCMQYIRFTDSLTH